MKLKLKKLFGGALAATLLAVAVPGEARVIDTSRLNPGQSMTRDVWINAGETPVFYVSADYDARDVDLYVTFPNGQRAWDNSVNPRPRVRFFAPVSGFYTVRVVMQSTRGGVWSAYHLHRL